jgi:uncharacterized protein
MEKEVEMFVAGLVLDPSSNAPIVILKDAAGGVCLPIWIGLAEATAIASALKKVEPIRPMTHDLLKNVIEQMGGTVKRIFIHTLEESTFHANIELAIPESYKIVDARPSDAIALAVRMGAPIVVAADVLSKAQVTVVGSLEGAEEEGADVPEGNTTDKNFATIEKEKWSDILAEMDPNDFKYKM